MSKSWLIVYVLLSLLAQSSFGQDSLSTFDKMLNFPTKFFQKINSSAGRLEAVLEKQTEKYLQKLAKQEARLKRKLSKIDSAASERIFANSKATYRKLLTDLNGKHAPTDIMHNSYVPFIDTLNTSMRFLEEADRSKLSGLAHSPAEIQEAISKLNLLQGKLNQTEEIKRLLIERKNYLKQQLAQVGLIKEFKKFEQNIYYYQEQVKQYKELLNDPKKLEATAIRLIQKIPAVANFLSTHSELASLFQLPNGPGINSPVNAVGLQTRSSVLQQMQQTLGAGANPQQMVQQGMMDLQGQLKQLKDKLTQSGGGGSTDQEMPDFKKNNLRTKSFLKRLEFGSNIQSVKGGYFFPVTTDVSLNIGYRISDRNVAGFGIAYKIGLGAGWDKIKLTHQGIGLRSFWDWKWKKFFWLSAGAEMNYRSEIKQIEVLKKFSAWQYAALAGISKKYQAGKKIQGNMQLLYDFLHAKQTPPSPAFVFRVGYTFSK